MSKAEQWTVVGGVATVIGVVVAVIAIIVSHHDAKSAEVPGNGNSPTAGISLAPSSSGSRSVGDGASRGTTPTFTAAIVELSGVNTKVEAPTLQYTVQNLAPGESAELQRTSGSTYKNVMQLNSGARAHLTPPALPSMGKYAYQIIILKSGNVTRTSDSVTVYAYGQVSLDLLGGNPGTLQVGARLFSYSQTTGNNSNPDYSQNQAFTTSSCRALTVLFSGGDEEQASGLTVSVEFVQTSTDPQYASAPAGVIRTVTVPLDGGPLFINTSSTASNTLDSWTAFNLTGSCYTPSGQLQTGQ
jgi:hypothetical protein